MPTITIGGFEYTGIVGLLLIAVGILWRALTAERRENRKAQATILHLTHLVEAMPWSLDRLRDAVNDNTTEVQKCEARSSAVSARKP